MTEQMKNELLKFKGFISESEADNLLKHQKPGETHPFIWMLSAVHDTSGDFECCKYNTTFAVSEIQRQDPKWLVQEKKKVLENKDYTNPSAALGEIRCYGYLLNIFEENAKSIHVGANKTPDFKIINGSEEVLIEVNTLQMNGDEAQELKEFHAQAPKENEKITIRETSVTPYGSKNAKCLSLNVIHKICQVKGKENQFSDKTPTILWIDMQSEYINMVSDRSTHSFPVFTGKGYSDHEEFFSNELWYAVYGEQGMPVFEAHSLDKYCGGFKAVLPLLEHGGRFSRKNTSKADGIIFSFPQSTIYYENPYSKKPIPNWCIEKLIQMHRFKIQCSKMNFPGRQLKKQLRIDKRTIRKLGKKEFYQF